MEKPISLATANQYCNTSGIVQTSCGRLIKSFTLSRELKQFLWILIVWFTHTLDQSDNLNSCFLVQNFKFMFINTPLYLSFSHYSPKYLHINVTVIIIICSGVFNTIRCLRLLKKPSRSIRRDKEKVLSLGHKTNQNLTNLNKKLPRYPFA